MLATGGKDLMADPQRSRRKMRRFPFLCAVQYVGSIGAGEGIIEDVSLEGMRVTGNYAVQADTFLAPVRVHARPR
jgi:hypothetical protein